MSDSMLSEKSDSKSEKPLDFFNAKPPFSNLKDEGIFFLESLYDNGFKFIDITIRRRKAKNLLAFLREMECFSEFSR